MLDQSGVALTYLIWLNLTFFYLTNKSESTNNCGVENPNVPKVIFVLIFRRTEALNNSQVMFNADDHFIACKITSVYRQARIQNTFNVQNCYFSIIYVDYQVKDGACVKCVGMLIQFNVFIIDVKLAVNQLFLNAGKLQTKVNIKLLICPVVFMLIQVYNFMQVSDKHFLLT